MRTKQQARMGDSHSPSIQRTTYSDRLTATDPQRPTHSDRPQRPTHSDRPTATDPQRPNHSNQPIDRLTQRPTHIDQPTAIDPQQPTRNGQPTGTVLRVDPSMVPLRTLGTSLVFYQPHYALDDGESHVASALFPLGFLMRLQVA